MSNSERPLVTFALIAYNQETYIGDAVRAALAQDYPNLEIIISDDSSTDGTWSVIQELVRTYSGRHRVVIRQNATNAGIAGHANQIFGLAKGELIVVAAGDDISYPERVSALAGEWVRCGRPEAVMHSSSRIIDANGSLTGMFNVGKGSDTTKASLRAFIASDFEALINGATAAYTPGIFDFFGPIQGEVEDLPLTFRGLLTGKLLYVSDVLVDYRIGVGNASGPLRRRNRKRIGRWLEGTIGMLRALRTDYAKYCDRSGIEPSDEVSRRLDRLEARYRSAIGLASPNPLRNLFGLCAFPAKGGIRDRLYFVAAYFGFKN